MFFLLRGAICFGQLLPTTRRQGQPSAHQWAWGGRLAHPERIVAGLSSDLGHAGHHHQHEFAGR
jgi:hypothetical protein